MDSGTNGVTDRPQDVVADASEDVGGSKGKGKAVDPSPDIPMGDDEEDEEGEEEEDPSAADLDDDEEEEEDMQEIEQDNIVESRTRGKVIDYAEAAQNMDEGELDDYDEDEDDDFEEEEDGDNMA